MLRYAEERPVWGGGECWDLGGGNAEGEFSIKKTLPFLP